MHEVRPPSEVGNISGGHAGSSLGSSLVAQRLKCLPAMRETWVGSLGQEDPLKEMATHSSILAWRIPWTEEPGGLQSTGWCMGFFSCSVWALLPFGHVGSYFPHQRSNPRWRRNRTGRPLYLLQIHRKNNRTVNKVYKTTSDR